MRCLFCKNNSDNSKSREHIIPESLGNERHMLPPGWVCDNCNNYLSRKVEAPFLGTLYGTMSRFEMAIGNKKGRIPIVTGFHPQSRSLVNLMIDKDGMSIFATQGEDEYRFMNNVRKQRKGSIYVPAAGDPQLSYDIARFIGKVALEILAYQWRNVEAWNEELVNKVELNELRNYVRQGRPGFVWPVNIRRIYPADNKFSDEIDPSFQILHEWDILFIPSSEHSECHGVVGEAYAIITILGVEYAMNLAGPELGGYLQWLRDHGERSYLYLDKNSQ